MILMHNDWRLADADLMATVEGRNLGVDSKAASLDAGLQGPNAAVICASVREYHFNDPFLGR